MPNKKHFARLNALKKNGPVSFQLMMETMMEFEGLGNEEAEKVCRDWLKNLSAEWTGLDGFRKPNKWAV